MERQNREKVVEELGKKNSQYIAAMTSTILKEEVAKLGRKNDPLGMWGGDGLILKMNWETTHVMIKNMEQEILENSLCFLMRAVKNLQNAESQNKHKELKYTILHLYSGIFLILKVRLYKEHWSLLVSNVDKAKLEDLKNGSFHGVSFEQCRNRLLQVTSLKELKDEDNKTLDTLRKRRNKLEHFFDDSISPESTKSILYKSLNFSIDFINEHIEESDIDEKLKEYINEIKQEASLLNQFCEERMNSITYSLEQKDVVLTCNECNNKALTCSEKDFLECLFCHNKVLPENYSEIYECEQKMRGIYRTKDVLCADEIMCSSCNEENAIAELSEDSDTKYICLHCQSKFDDLYTCDHCNTMFPVEIYYDEESGWPIGTCPACEGRQGMPHPNSSVWRD